MKNKEKKKAIPSNLLRVGFKKHNVLPLIAIDLHIPKGLDNHLFICIYIYIRTEKRVRLVLVMVR